MSGEFSHESFGASFHDFMEKMAANAPTRESPILDRLREHFGTDPRQFPIVSQEFPGPQMPDVQNAIDRYLARAPRTHDLLGVHGESPFGGALSDLLAPSRAGMHGAAPPAVGPVVYHSFSLGGDRSISCVAEGLYFIFSAEERLVLYRRKSAGPFSRGESFHVDVMARERATAEALLREVMDTMRTESVYRSKVVSVEVSYSGYDVNFHDVPRVERQEIILPEGLLDRVDEQTLLFAKHREALLAAGRHLRRGILLYGPPGTGKTMTARYIATSAPDRTVFLLTGRGIGNLEKTCELARQLAPSTIILEDVDLIAEERTNQAAGCSPLLFELLTRMDGVAGDLDVLFVLTTNRPELLEPALAARPGRVDVAIEVPPPDADCRRRLFERYGQGLGASSDVFGAFIDRTAGVSAAFIAELLRRAALRAAVRATPIEVRGEDVDIAMREMLIFGGALQRRLLGAKDAIGYRVD